MEPDRSGLAAPEDARHLVDVRFELRGGAAVVVVRGELDFFTSTALADGLAQAVASGVARTVLDLTETTFVSLAAFRVMLDAKVLLALREGDLVVRNPPPTLRVLDDAFTGCGLAFETASVVGPS